MIKTSSTLDLELSKEDRDKLEALDYTATADRDPQPSRSGVIFYNERRASVGWNLFNSRLRSRAWLIDMSGCVVHTWSHTNLKGGWHHTELLPNGNLAVIAKESYLAILDQSSKILWKKDVFAHHDLAVHSDGSITALVWEERNVQSKADPLIVRDEFLVTFSAEGIEQERLSLWPLLQHALSPQRRAMLARLTQRGKMRDWSKHRDIFHINSLEVLDRPLRDVPKSAAGHVLLTVRNLNLIVLIDPAEKSVVWSSRRDWTPSQRPKLDRPHNATRVGERLMIFNNAPSRGQSKVLELNWKDAEVSWSYPPKGGDSIFSRTRGAAQKLPNGNVLITESNAGRVLEVTPDHSIVWMYLNPDREPHTQKRGAIYRMTRLPNEAFQPIHTTQRSCKKIEDLK